MVGAGATATSFARRLISFSGTASRWVWARIFRFLLWYGKSSLARRRVQNLETYRTGLLFVPLQTPASKAGWIPPMTHPRFENPRGTAPERERTFVFVCRGVTDREEGTRPQGANRLSPPTTASPASGGLLKRPTAILVGGRHVDAGLPESVKLPSPSVHPVALQPSVYSRPIGLSEPRKPTSDDISIFYLKILYENHPVQARRACTFMQANACPRDNHDS
jgi:hypothetical protein